MLNRLRRGFDPGQFVVLLICLLAVWPLISRAGLPEGTDAELHIFRLHELSYLVRGGEFYPRWAPNFYHGYGYPIFNYYAPLAYYMALPLELLPSVDAVLAIKAVLVVGMLLGGMGIYGFTRDNWGRGAGYVAAALLVYSPYLQYIDPHVRGVVPEMLSFGLFPLALWALDRLRRRPSAGSWLASVFLTAGIILSHNLMGLFLFGLLAAWVVWQAVPAYWLKRTRAVKESETILASRAIIVRLIAALALGLGLAAVFWLPVFLERNAVTLNTLIGEGDNYDFRTHFLSLIELLSPSVSPDWGATQSPFRFNLGIAQWLGGFLGLIMLAFGRVRQRDQLFFFALAAGGTIFLMTSASQSIWEAIPFLPYFQFPWRLLGAAAALLAVLAAGGVDALAGSLDRRALRKASPIRSTWVYGIAVGAAMLFALPLSQPTPWEPFGEVNSLRISLIENSGRWLGTTSTADYVPATVITLPTRRDSVVGPIAQGLPPDRVNREALPDGAVVTTETVRPLLTRYHVYAPKKFRLRLYQFDFPGWRVTTDGEPAVTELAEPEGFIVVLVPQGEHVIEVEFGTTPPRMLGWAIAGISLILALVGAWRITKRRKSSREGEGYNWRAQLRADLPVIAIAGGLTAIVLLLQPLGLFHNKSHGRDLDLDARELYANFGDQITLLGHTEVGETASPGSVIEFTVFWRALRKLEISYQSFVHVLDANGELVAQSDKLNPGEFPTNRWPLDKYVPDIHRITLPDDLPAGEYTIVTGLWVMGEGWRLPVFDENGDTIGDKVELFRFKVE